MPAIYAHHSFGRKVYKQLPENLRDIARRFPDEFKAGLQGPDFLFFYNPFKSSNNCNQLGQKLHDQPVNGFLKRAQKILNVTGLDSGEGAYILGFICHFSLDNACHGFVEAMVKETGQSHTEQETEFDRYILTLENKNAGVYPLYRLVKVNQSLASLISEFYVGISTNDVAVSLLNMRAIKKLLLAKNPVKELVLDKGAELILKDSEKKSHIMHCRENPECRNLVKGLYVRYTEAVPVCVEAIKGFAEAFENKSALPKHFDHSFN